MSSFGNKPNLFIISTWVSFNSFNDIAEDNGRRIGSGHTRLYTNRSVTDGIHIEYSNEVSGDEEDDDKNKKKKKKKKKKKRNAKYKDGDKKDAPVPADKRE